MLRSGEPRGAGARRSGGGVVARLKKGVVVFAALYVAYALVSLQLCRGAVLSLWPSSMVPGAEQQRNVLTGRHELALQQSEGWFDDIDDAHWLRMKQRHHDTPNNLQDRGTWMGPGQWYQENWEPTISCLHERRLGQRGDGGKWVCDPHRIDKKACLVYSVGSHGDYSFETSVHEGISEDCEIHTFDFSVDTAVHPPPAYVNFHREKIVSDSTPWRIGGVVVKHRSTIQDLRRKLGHEGRTIDILKIDCEGCEWRTFETWFGAGAAPIRQILMEVHGIRPDWAIINDDHVDKRDAPPAQLCFEHLQKMGYVVFHKEPNIQYTAAPYQGLEYGFLKLSPDFQTMPPNSASFASRGSRPAQTAHQKPPLKLIVDGEPKYAYPT